MNEIKKLVEESVKSLFESHANSDAVEIMESGGFPAKFWSDFSEAGWTHVALPEDDGGAGMGLAGAYILMRLSGYHAVPLPIVESLLAAYLLGIAGLPIPEGPTTVAVADLVSNQANGGGGEVAIRRVPWARHAKSMVVVIPGGDNAGVALVDSAIRVERARANMAGEPRDDVVLKGGALDGMRELPGVSAERVLAWLAMGRAAQMTGALFRTLERTIEYANERKQFGQLIGKFQAVQQQISVQAEYAYAARCAVDAAIMHLDTPQEWECIAAAKISAGEAAGKACGIAHAVHAAIGFTQEHPLQMSTRRLWAWRDEYGNEARWSAKLGDLCFGLGSGGLWPWLTEQTINKK